MKTQADIVADGKGYQEKYETRKVIVPGIESLHTKSATEIAEVLSMVLRSQKNIVEFTYKVGQYIELSYEP